MIVQKFGIFIISGKTGTFEKFGSTEEFWKNVTIWKFGIFVLSRKKQDIRKSRVH